MCARGMHERLQPCVPEACMRGCSPVSLQGERDWLHANSVDWTLGPDGVGYVLISYNVPSEVVVVRWPAAGAVGEAGEPAGEGESGILFRFGNPLVARTGDRHARQLFCQHSAKWVQGSHGAGGSSLRFILFNNGCAPHRRVLRTRSRQPLPHRGRQPLPTRAPRNDPAHSRLQPHTLPAPRQQPLVPSLHSKITSQQSAVPNQGPAAGGRSPLSLATEPFRAREQPSRSVLV